MDEVKKRKLDIIRFRLNAAAEAMAECWEEFEEMHAIERLEEKRLVELDDKNRLEEQREYVDALGEISDGMQCVDEQIADVAELLGNLLKSMEA